MTKSEEILYSKIGILEQIEINGKLEHMIKLSEALEAVNEALILPIVVRQSEQLCSCPTHYAMNIGLVDQCAKCGAKE